MQNGSDAFMGVMRKVEEDPRIAKCYLLPTGYVLTISKAFTSMLGWTFPEVAGGPLDVIFTGQEQAMSILKRTVEGNAVTTAETSGVVSKFGEEFEVEITTELAGSEDARIIVLTIKRIGIERAAAVVAADGKFLAANSTFETMTGYTDVMLRNMSVVDMMQASFLWRCGVVLCATSRQGRAFASPRT